MKSLTVVFLLLILFQHTTYSQRQNKAIEVVADPITMGETLRITSKRLGEDRQILVYLPSNYATSKQRYPVIYTLDGEGTASVTASAVEFMTGYSEFPQMPEAIVVGITNTDRPRDMPIPEGYGKGGEENFLAFLADELIPMIEQRYRTQPLRILVGHSQGGLFVYYAMTAQPTPFQWYLPVDAPLSGFAPVKPIMDKARTLVNKTPNYRGRLVAIENLYGWLKEWPSLVDTAPKTFYGARVEIKDETHETMFYKSVYEGLKRLFHDYTPVEKDAKLFVLDAKYKVLSEAYGYQVDIPQQVLLRSANRNVQAREGAEAVKLIQRAVALYGETPNTKVLMTMAEEAVKKGGPDPRIAEWAKLPPPGVEQMKPFLGTWEWKLSDGAHWFITFEVKDGVVRAQNSVTPPSGESFQLVVHFVKVIDGKTLQWGERNGRGPGVTVFTAKLVDKNTLEGIAEGIDFFVPRPPDTFTFKRGSR